MQNTELAESNAVAVAEIWLALIDADKIAESWSEAASLFRAAFPVEQWEAKLKAAQTLIGKALSRKLRSATYAEELPGAPDGEYVVIEYETSFEKKKNGIETITPMKDTDGVWRVAGYFVK